MDTAIWSHSQYQVRRKFFKLFGAAFFISDGTGTDVMYADLKAFKLKEDVTLYSRQDKQTAILRIQARNIIDFSAAYDVTEADTGVKIGALKRKGLRSTFLRDEWLLMDANDNEFGIIKEDNPWLAIVRRWLTNLIPQKYTAEVNGSLVCNFRQNFNPFLLKLNVDFSPDVTRILDKRLGLAAAVLLCAIEGRQD